MSRWVRRGTISRGGTGWSCCGRPSRSIRRSRTSSGRRAAGHDAAARRVLIAQRRDQLDRHALTGRAERTWAKLTGVTLGYGYQPWRALLVLLAIVAAAAAGERAAAGRRPASRSRVARQLAQRLTDRTDVQVEIRWDSSSASSRTRGRMYHRQVSSRPRSARATIPSMVVQLPVLDPVEAPPGELEVVALRLVIPGPSRASGPPPRRRPGDRRLIGLGAIAAKTGIPKTSLHRYLAPAPADESRRSP